MAGLLAPGSSGPPRLPNPNRGSVATFEEAVPGYSGGGRAGFAPTSLTRPLGGLHHPSSLVPPMLALSAPRRKPLAREPHSCTRSSGKERTQATALPTKPRLWGASPTTPIPPPKRRATASGFPGCKARQHHPFSQGCFPLLLQPARRVATDPWPERTTSAQSEKPRTAIPCRTC